MKFEWDLQKAVRNLEKHGVTFQEASTVFRDPLSATAHDPDHSFSERRFITIGLSRQGVIAQVFRLKADVYQSSRTARIKPFKTFSVSTIVGSISAESWLHKNPKRFDTPKFRLKTDGF